MENPKKYFYKINKKIEIDLSNIIVPLSEKIKDFKLIGQIDRGKFSRSLQKEISVIIAFRFMKTLKLIKKNFQKFTQTKQNRF